MTQVIGSSFSLSPPFFPEPSQHYFPVVYVFHIGGVNCIFCIFWVAFAHSTPATDPRISAKERAYIEEGTANLDQAKVSNLCKQRKYMSKSSCDHTFRFQCAWATA